MQKFRPKCCQQFQFSPFLGQKSPKIVIGYSYGTVVPPNDVSTSKKFFGRALKFFWCEKKFSAAPGTHMPKFRPKWPQILTFLAQNRPFLDFFGAVESQNVLSTMKIVWGAEKSIFYSRKIFRPRRAPICRNFGQNDSKIYRFGVKIDLFGLFRACGARKWAHHEKIFGGTK